MITNDEEYTEINKLTSVSTFPQIFINSKFIGGYSELYNLSVKGKLSNILN